MKYAHYNKDGQILGFYDDGIHPNIPKPNLKLTDMQWQDCIDNEGLRVIDVNTKAIVEFTPPAPTLDELKAQAKVNVLAFASDIRAKVVGQVDQYKLAGWNDKSQRAQRIFSDTATDADFTILQAECDKRGKGETPQELAQNQAAKSHVLAIAGAIIDGMESAALTAIKSKRSQKSLDQLQQDLKAKADKELKALLGNNNA